MNDLKIEIEGMSCNHCANRVKNAIAGIEGVEFVEINLSDKAAYVAGDYDLQTVKDAVNELGYKAL